MNQADGKTHQNRFDDVIIAKPGGATAELHKNNRSTIGLQSKTHAQSDRHAGELRKQVHWLHVIERVRNLERGSRRLKYSLLIITSLLFYLFVNQAFTEFLIPMDSVASPNRMQFFDEEGNVRMYMRVYSGVPVMQLIDESGTPRLSLGLRYDDSPFISLSDVSGHNRVSLQLGADDQPELKLTDENGNASFRAH